MVHQISANNCYRYYSKKKKMAPFRFLPLRASITLFLLLFLAKNSYSGILQDDISHQMESERNGEHFLSRKRRYLTFPEGSSFQVVFCLTYPSIAVGSIFVFGNTAALAWELPSTPIFFNYKDFTTTTTEAPTTTEAWNIEDLVHDYPDDHQESNDRFDRYGYDDRNSVSKYSNPIFDYVYPQKFGYFPQKNGYSPLKTGYSTQKSGYSPHKNEYPSQNIKYSPQNLRYSPPVEYSSQKYGYSSQKLPNKVNNFSQKSEYTSQYSKGYKKFDNIHQNKAQNGNGGTRNYEESKSYSRLLYQGENRRTQVHPSRSYVDPIYHAVHRRTRRDLYGKLQNFLTTLNIDGKNCILKAICEVNQKTKEKGSFIEEIIKTIFRIKPEDGYPNEDHFDFASNKTHVCQEQYPSCKGSIFSDMFIFNNKQ